LIDWSIPRRLETEGPPRTIYASIDPADRIDVLLQLALVAVLCVLLMGLMHYVRRWLRRLRDRADEPDVLPGQDAAIELIREEPAAPPPRLPGLRGRIVALWGGWEARLARDGRGRHPGETARQHATRLERETPEAAPTPAMTALLERAHYSPEKMTENDLAAMRGEVEAALRREKGRD
jgi:hypothetical protein